MSSCDSAALNPDSERNPRLLPRTNVRGTIRFSVQTGGVSERI